MTTSPAPNQDEARYWNEEGGQRWVRYIDRLERMLEGFSAHLLRAVDARPGERILDIGCGGGPTSAAYADAVGATGEVVGADISAVILEVARRRYVELANLQFITADAASHAFTPGHFDVITSRYGVMFFPDPRSAFRNLRGAGRSGGRLCFLCWRSLAENPWMGAPAQAAFGVVPAPEKPAPGTPGPFSLADPERLRGLLGESGYSGITLDPIDETINLGSVEEALDWLGQMGPAAKPVADAEPALAARARAAMREVLEAKLTPQGVCFPGAAWLVRARLG